MLITAIIAAYFSLFALGGAIGANVGMLGAFPADNPTRTLTGIGLGLWLAVTWPFILVGF